MDRIKVLAILTDENNRYELKRKLMNDEIMFMGFARTGDAAMEKVLSFKPDAVVFAGGGETGDMLGFAGQVYVSSPGCAILLLSDRFDLPFFEQAMQAGIRKVLDVNCEAEQLVESIKACVRLERSRIKLVDSGVANVVSKVITVFGAKGGIGKSTIAANLAAALAHRGKRVAVLDLDLQFGDISLFYDLDPKDTIAELVQEYGTFDYEILKGYMQTHSSSVSILCAPKSPEMAETIRGESVERIINIVRSQFDYVIVDTPPYFNDISLVAVENADMVLQVITLEISTLRNTKMTLDIFKSLQQADKVSVLVNRDSSGLISVKDAQSILECPIKYRVSSDWKTAVAALNRGIPIIFDAPRSTIAKELFEMADLIAGIEEKKGKK